MTRNPAWTPHLLAACLLACLPGPCCVAGLVITEVVEGTSGNLKYVELTNTGPTTVTLAAPQIVLRRYSNGGTTPTALNLTGRVAPGAFFIIAHNQADLDAAYGAGVVSASQLSASVITHNGDDAYDLYDGATVLDAFARDWATGSDPGNPAADGVYVRVRSAWPNNGDWGGSSINPIADGTASPSGFWLRRALGPGNGGAAALSTPLAAGVDEVPVEVAVFRAE